MKYLVLVVLLSFITPTMAIGENNIENPWPNNKSNGYDYKTHRKKHKKAKKKKRRSHKTPCFVQ